MQGVARVNALEYVTISEVEGGYAWDCSRCGRFAGRPLPGQEGDPNIPFRNTTLPSGEAITAESFVQRAARNHEEKVCIGR